MSDQWEDEGFGGGGAPSDAEGEDDWDQGDEGIAPELEDGFDDPDELDDDGWDEGEES